MNEFKVGLMAIVTMIMVVYMSLKITSNQSGFGDYVSYRTIVTDASGIFPKTPIKIAGINAGRIQKIELQGNKALIGFEVRNDLKITANSVLKIKSVGFLGDKYLEILIGDSPNLLEEQSFIIAEEGAGMEKLVKDVGEVMKDVKIMVKSLKDSISPEGEESPIKKILNDTKELVDNTKVATASLKRMMTGNEDRLNKIVRNLEVFSEKLSYHLDEEREASAMSDVKQILSNTDDLTADLKALIVDVKSGKGTIGKFLVEDEIADEVKATLAGVKKIVGKVDQIRTELAVYSGANTDYGAETSASLKIFPAPERFYLLGITTSEFGPETEKLTTKVVNGVESNETEKVRYKDTYRFNIQIGRKINNWSFRGGLIESTGGFGVDYDLERFGSRFSMEVFDYREDIGVNLRLATEVQLWNVFFGKVAIEDIIEESRSATISAGLRFNDEDMKGLIGFFL